MRNWEPLCSFFLLFILASYSRVVEVKFSWEVGLGREEEVPRCNTLLEFGTPDISRISEV